MSIYQYKDQIYAGVLGKIIGVYMGRPIEGWSYDRINKSFGEVNYYVNEEVGVPLIVADDDISGTFAFFRSIEDNGFDKNISAKKFGDTWLNYIIENKTILWWGGLGRSTEHTAFLNLKSGIPAPKSGSIETNGKTLAEQIGAQIFIDAIAMACPNNPGLAVELVRKAASVSHDGLAVDAACHLAALESLAFEEKNIDVLLDKAKVYMKSQNLIEIVSDVRNICAKENDWRIVRDYLDKHYGYNIYPGCCHMVPNHSMLIASFILGGDDFQKSISIATSAGWDTDCNAGNVGALNGIRLGIEGLNAGADFRKPVADMMYVVTSDGGSVVSDAVIESRRILKTAARMSNENMNLSNKRYTFEFPGSLQGFKPCEYESEINAVSNLSNLNESINENGLLISCTALAKGVTARVSTLTFIDFSKVAYNFSTVASPTLYSSQIVKADIYQLAPGNIWMRPYILYYDINDVLQIFYGEYVPISMESRIYEWIVPDTKGMSIAKLGYEFKSDCRYNGDIVIKEIDWKGAPTYFAQKGMLMNSIWNTNPMWLAGFCSSADHFAADFNHTYCVSHAENDGLVTIGTRDWENYSVESTVYYSLHKNGGLVIRSVGHKRYYAAVLEEYKYAVLFVQKDGNHKELGRVKFNYFEDLAYNLRLSAMKNHLAFSINGEVLIEADDETYNYGGGGFVVSRGTMTCEDLIIRGV